MVITLVSDTFIQRNNGTSTADGSAATGAAAPASWVTTVIEGKWCG